MKNKNGYTSVELLIVIAIAAMIVVTTLFSLQHVVFTEQLVIEVTDKERIVERSGDSVSSKYLVFTSTETFENSDSLIYWKWDSSDVYGKIKEGNSYAVKVTGLRVPLFSLYRNIVSLDTINKNEIEK